MIDPFAFPNAMPLPLGFVWCAGCEAAREHWHRHGDPLEEKTPAELLELVRSLQADLGDDWGPTCGHCGNLEKDHPLIGHPATDEEAETLACEKFEEIR